MEFQVATNLTDNQLSEIYSLHETENVVDNVTQKINLKLLNTEYSYVGLILILDKIKGFVLGLIHTDQENLKFVHITYLCIHGKLRNKRICLKFISYFLDRIPCQRLLFSGDRTWDYRFPGILDLTSKPLKVHVDSWIRPLNINKLRDAKYLLEGDFEVKINKDRHIVKCEPEHYSYVKNYIKLRAEKCEINNDNNDNNDYIPECVTDPGYVGKYDKILYWKPSKEEYEAYLNIYDFWLVFGNEFKSWEILDLLGNGTCGEIYGLFGIMKDEVAMNGVNLDVGNVVLHCGDCIGEILETCAQLKCDLVQGRCLGDMRCGDKMREYKCGIVDTRVMNMINMGNDCAGRNYVPFL